MNDTLAVRLALLLLGLVALAVVVGGIILAIDDKTLPGELIAIGSASIGAVAGVVSVSSKAA